MKKPMVKSRSDHGASSDEVIEEIKAKITPAREKYLRKQIKRLSNLENEAYRPRHGRLDFYNYLEKILKLNWVWADEGARKTKGQQVGALMPHPLSPREGRTALHFLIEASSQQKSTIKSRWVRALVFASKHRQSVTADGLAEFISQHGGIAGCAAKVAKPNQKTRRKAKLQATMLGTIKR